MSTRRVARVLPSRATIATLLVLLVPTSAMADRHTADIGGGVGRSGRSELWGIGLTGDWIPKGGDWPCKPLDDKHSYKHSCTLGLAVEFSRAKGDHEGGTLSQRVFQAGPRFTYNKPAKGRVQLFAVALPGVTVEKNGQDRTSFSLALGGGADVLLPIFMKQIGDKWVPVWVTRVQYTRNWIDNHRSDDSYWQLGISLVYRFE